MKYYLKLIFLSMKRRKKEMRYVTIVTLISTFFLSSVSIFQDIANRWMKEQNYQNYGEWILSSVEDFQKDNETKFVRIQHPYIQKETCCTIGGEILKEDNTKSGLYIGTAEKDFLKMGNISVYEGRMPKEENEIIMDLPSLAALGYSYDIGQRIKIKTQNSSHAEPIIQEVEYILVGTMKNFSGNWMSDSRYPLPNCLVHPLAFEKAYQEFYTTHFYSLDRAFEELDIHEFARPFCSGNSAVLENTYAYTNRLWGSSEMFRTTEILLIAISMLAIGYLFLSYHAKRKKWYYRYRCTGASALQIRIMILVECFCCMIPWAMLGIILAYSISGGACYFIAKNQNIPYFFAYEPNTLIKLIVFVLVIIMTSIACAFLATTDKKLERNTKELSEKQLQRLRKKIKRKNTVSVLWSRTRKLHPYRNASSILFSVIVCTLLLLCTNKIYETIHEYEWEKEILQDFEADQKISRRYEWKEDGEIYTEEREHYSLVDGISKELEARMESLTGIHRMEKQIWDDTYTFYWKGIEKSPIIKKKKQLQNAGMIHEGAPTAKQTNLIRCVENYQEILNQEKEKSKQSFWNETEFLNGNQVLYIQGNYYPLDNSKILKETTIKPGAYIQIKGETPNEVLNVQVGAVLDGESDWQVSGYENKIIGSMGLAKKLAGFKGKEPSFNKVYLEFNKYAAFESTETQLASMFQENGMSYSSDREALRNAESVFVRKISLYTIIIAVIMVVYFMMLLNFQETSNYYERERYQRLRQMGMDQRTFDKLAFKDELKHDLWIIFAVPLSNCITYMITLLEVKKTIEQGGGFYSERLERFTTNMIRATFIEIENKIAWKENWILLLFVILLLVGIRVSSARKMKGALL